MSRVLILDCEIEKAIPDKNKPLIEGIQYAQDWIDYVGMGIACIGAWESWSDRYRVFEKPRLEECISARKTLLQRSLEQADYIVTWNGIGFDANLLLAHSVVIPKEKHIDLLVEVRDKQGFDKYTKGFRLDDVAKANGLQGKSGDGPLAPVLWQQGKYCEVIDYCLNDVWLTKKLLQRCIDEDFICPIRNEVVSIKLPLFTSLRKEAYPEDYVQERKEIN